MARHKFEQQFKKGLQKREIAPSAGGWDRLENKLNSRENNSKNNKFWWLGIAATLAGGIFIGGLVYNNPAPEETPTIVETPVQTIEHTAPLDENNRRVAVEEKITSQNNSGEKGKRKSTTNAVANAVEKETPETYRSATRVVYENKRREEVNNPAEEDMKFEYDLPGQKLEEILAKVSSNEFTDADPSIEEVDALLYKAATEISLQQNKNYRAGAIHPNDLLFEVEMELEQSFRDRVFDVLKDGYLKARTAVANRNNLY